MERVRIGDLSPVFFGSALTNFGVETFLEHFLKMTTPPLSRKTLDGVIDPFRPDFSAFVFKNPGQREQGPQGQNRFLCVSAPASSRQGWR